MHPPLTNPSTIRQLLGPNKKCYLAAKPYPITPRQFQVLQRLGKALHAFQRALHLLYKYSYQGKTLPQIAQLLDAGKPAPLIRAARHPSHHNQLPKLIRPDLLVTDNNFSLCEIDSIPGGIGLTAWLQETYATTHPNVIGAPNGIRHAFHTTFPSADVLVSQEAADYYPEWHHFLNGQNLYWAETYQPTGRPIYRFFETFDHHLMPWLSLDPPTPMQPPLKPQLEEKLALALFWLKPLETFWRQQIGEAYFQLLRQIIPRTWILTPEPLPWHAVIPELNVHSWSEVASFSQRQRRLVLKISGYSPLAWGSRGVTFGHDIPSEAWRAAIETALQKFETQPYILQPFIEGRLETHEYFTDDSLTATAPLTGRTRLCPYYFVHNDQVTLAGILATHCPANKKALHGMSEAVLMPCALE